MKVALVAMDERNAFLLEQLEREGHEVCLLSRNYTGAWEGLVPRSKGFREVVEWGPDVAIVDSPGLGSAAKALTDSGIPTLGGGKLMDKINDNYLFGMSFLSAAQVRTSEFERFTDAADAAEYVHGKSRPWLFRNSDGTCRCCRDDVDLQFYMESLIQAGKMPAEFAVQLGFPEHLDKELMLRPQSYWCGLYNSTGLMNPCLRLDVAHNLLPAGQGVPTVEGVNLRPVAIGEASVLRQLEKPLRAINYTGWVFVGCVRDWDERTGESVECAVDIKTQPPDGFWAAILRGLTMSFANFLDRAANPKRPNAPFEFWPGHTASRKLSLPPYPLTEAPWLSDAQRQDLGRNLLPPTRFRREPWGVYWSEVWQPPEDRGYLHARGVNLGYVVGRGTSHIEAVEEAMRVTANLPIQFAQVRVEDGLAEFNLCI